METIASLQPVPYEVFYTLYKKVPSEKKELLKDFLDVQNLKGLFNRNFISFQRYERLQEFVNLIEKTAFSRVIDRSVIDWPQKETHLKTLTRYISGSDFRKLTHTKRTTIIYQQNKLYNQISEYKNNINY